MTYSDGPTFDGMGQIVSGELSRSFGQFKQRISDLERQLTLERESNRNNVDNYAMQVADLERQLASCKAASAEYVRDTDGQIERMAMRVEELERQLAACKEQRDLAEERHREEKAISKERNAEIERLKAEVGRLKLKWQTGKPPKDGWYWFTFHGILVGPIQVGYYRMKSDDFQCWETFTRRSDRQWAGPIEPPEEP